MTDVRVPLRSLAAFTGQLGLMLDSGFPIISALGILGRSEEPRVNKVAEHLARELAAGHRLSAAMAKVPGCFDRVYVRLIHTGESSGRLARILAVLGQDLERYDKKLRELKQALTYPVAVAATSALMLAFMLYYMLPHFMVFFRGFGAQLPWPTRLLMLLTDNPAIKFGLPGLAVTAFFLPFLGRLQDRDMAWLQHLKFGLPLVGKVNAELAVARTCGNLAMLGQQGLGLVESLKLLSGTTGYDRLDEELLQVAERITRGDSFAEALRGGELFPRMVWQTVAAGQEAGDVYTCLRYSSRLLEEQAEVRLGTLLTLLEPMTMGVMGAVVGFIVIAIFLPIYQLATLNI